MRRPLLALPLIALLACTPRGDRPAPDAAPSCPAVDPGADALPAPAAPPLSSLPLRRSPAPLAATHPLPLQHPTPPTAAAPALGLRLQAPLLGVIDRGDAAPVVLDADGLQGEAEVWTYPVAQEQIQPLLAHLRQSDAPGWRPFGAPGAPEAPTRRLRAPLRGAGVRRQARLSPRDLFAEGDHLYLAARHPAWTQPDGTPRWVAAVLQRTDLDLAAVYDLDQAAITASHLQTGATLEGVTLRLLDRDGAQVWSGVTDADGRAEAPGPRRFGASGARGPMLLLGARPAVDGAPAMQAALPLDGRGARGYLKPWQGEVEPAEEAPRFFLTSDRVRYGSGQTAALLGVARPAEGGAALAPEAAWEPTVRPGRRAARMDVPLDRAPVSPAGLFLLRVPLPEAAAPQPWPLTLHLGAHTFTHTAQLQPAERAAAELEVLLSTEHVDEFNINISKNINNLNINYQVDTSPIDPAPRQAPPGFTFASPLAGPLATPAATRAALERYRAAEAAGPLRGQGEVGSGAPLEVEVALGTGAERLRWSVTGADAFGGRAATTVTLDRVPWPALAGLRLETALLQAGARLRLEALAVDPGGAPLSGRALELRLERLDRPAPPVVAALTSGAAPTRWESPPLAAGAWSVRLSDAGGHAVEHGVVVYDDAGAALPGGLGEDPVALVADLPAATPPGQVRLLIVAPRPGLTGDLTLERAGLRAVTPLRLTGRTALITVPLDPALAPNVRAVVHLRAGRQGGLPPAMLRGAINLPVAAPDQRLTLHLEPDASGVRASVTDAAGQPVTAQLTLIAADARWPSALPEAADALLGVLAPTRAEGTVAASLRDRRVEALPDASPPSPPDQAPPADRQAPRRAPLLLPPDAIDAAPITAEATADATGAAHLDLPVDAAPRRALVVALDPAGRAGAASLLLPPTRDPEPVPPLASPPPLTQRTSTTAALTAPARLPLEPGAPLTLVLARSPWALIRPLALDVLAAPPHTPAASALQLLMLAALRRRSALLSPERPELADPSLRAVLDALQRMLADQEDTGGFQSLDAHLPGAAALQVATDQGLPVPPEALDRAWRRVETLLLALPSPLTLTERAIAAGWLEQLGRPLPASTLQQLRQEAQGDPLARALLTGAAAPDAPPEARIAARWTALRSGKRPDDARRQREAAELARDLRDAPHTATLALILLPLLEALHATPKGSPAPPRVALDGACVDLQPLGEDAWSLELAAPAGVLTVLPAGDAPLYLTATRRARWGSGQPHPDAPEITTTLTAGERPGEHLLTLTLGGAARPLPPGVLIVPLPEGVTPLPEPGGPVAARLPAPALTLRVERPDQPTTLRVRLASTQPFPELPTPALLLDGLLTPVTLRRKGVSAPP